MVTAAAFRIIFATLMPWTMQTWIIRPAPMWKQSDFYLSSYPQESLVFDGWAQRSVKSTIQCENFGCQASTNLDLFNADTEEAMNCKLDLHIHPTDFDDQYSGERLVFVRVNGLNVNEDCFPLRSGCNSSITYPMFACVQQLPVDKFIVNGSLNVEAKISDVVDECPYNGNLLSGVPTVTCMVRQKARPRHRAGPTYPVPDTFSGDGYGPGGGGDGGRGGYGPGGAGGGGGGGGWDGWGGRGGKLSNSGGCNCDPNSFIDGHMYICVPYHCAERGCRAHIDVRLYSDAVAFDDLQCLMNINLCQTDFDSDNSDEHLDFVMINNQTIEFEHPTKNPCKSKYEGEEMTREDIEHTLVKNRNANDLVMDGAFTVDAKISPWVDECAHNGNLLDGFVEVSCAGIRLI